MMTRGLFMAITDDELRALKKHRRDSERKALAEQWKETLPADLTCATDKLPTLNGYLNNTEH